MDPINHFMLKHEVTKQVCGSAVYNSGPQGKRKLR